MIGAGGAYTKRGANQETGETGSTEIWSEISNINRDQPFGLRSTLLIEIRDLV